MAWHQISHSLSLCFCISVSLCLSQSINLLHFISLSFCSYLSIYHFVFIYLPQHQSQRCLYILIIMSRSQHQISLNLSRYPMIFDRLDFKSHSLVFTDEENAVSEGKDLKIKGRQEKEIIMTPRKFLICVCALSLNWTLCINPNSFQDIEVVLSLSPI